MLKLKVDDLAIFSDKPIFQNTIPVGQLNMPKWELFETKFRDIFERQYYTNQGPLVDEFEEKLQNYLGVKHAICMVNATIALIISAKAMGLTGKVICPAFTFIATAQSLSWANLEPVFCDIDPSTHQMSTEFVSNMIDDEVSAILGVHLWGNPCSPGELENIAEKNNIQIYFDAAHAFGCSFSNKKVGNFGKLEVFSFHATKILNATEGGCVCTNDDYIASKLRNIRSSYGAREAVDIPFTGNGRMSEAQAAMGLLSLDEIETNIKRNGSHFDIYKQELSSVNGISVISPSVNDVNNYQYMVIVISKNDFGLSRDDLHKILQAENISCRKYFSPGIHRSIPYCRDLPGYIDILPNTDEISNSVMQLPLGQQLTNSCIYKICEIIKFSHENATELNQKVT